MLITQAMDGGPAAKAGVRAYDEVTHVDGVDISQMTLEKAIELVKGKEHTVVVLTIKRQDEVLEIEIARGKIVIENVQSKMIGFDELKLGYVKLGSFMKPFGCEQVSTAVQDLTQSGAKGIVFDLRNNGGGYLSQSVCISDIFLETDKTVLTTRSVDGVQILSNHTTKKERQSDVPLVVLMNASSASASEIVAGALQDYQRAFLVGERSFGKGSVQKIRSIAPKLLMKETIARFYLPSGRTNQVVGVLPDFEAFSKPNPNEDEKFSVREEDLYGALLQKSDPWNQQRQEDISFVEYCLGEKGSADSRYQQGKKLFQVVDYQQMVAEDVLRCTVAHPWLFEEVFISETEITPNSNGINESELLINRIEAALSSY